MNRSAGIAFFRLDFLLNFFIKKKVEINSDCYCTFHTFLSGTVAALHQQYIAQFIPPTQTRWQGNQHTADTLPALYSVHPDRNRTIPAARLTASFPKRFRIPSIA